MSFSQRCSYLVPGVAALLGLGACTHRAEAPAQAAAPPSAALAAPIKPSAPAAPSDDERLRAALDHLGASRGARGEMVTFEDTALFTAGSAALKPGAAGDLQQVGSLLRDYPRAGVLIEGYTDDRGGRLRDDELSLQRANAVRQALLADGVAEHRVRARGLGPAAPVADNHTRSGREQNDRVVVVFSDSSGQFAQAADRTSG
jgi:outer membrane protein OmpA-like peptidoglycan-associated protein